MLLLYIVTDAKDTLKDWYRTFVQVGRQEYIETDLV